MYVEMKNIFKQYGNFRASDNVNFGIEKGKLVALLGPSGSGKTTILRMIAGLETPSFGDIYLSSLLAIAEEREGHEFILLDDAVGVSFRTDKYHSHRLVPEPAQAAPGSCHHIELILVAGANQHPFLANSLEDIIIQFFYVDFLHFIFSFLCIF